MISKLRKKLILLFVTLTMLVFTIAQITMVYANIEDVWLKDLALPNKIADQVIQECMDIGSIKDIDLSKYVELYPGHRFLIYLSDGQEKNTNADLWGDAGKALEEMVRTGRETGPDMSRDFDDWDGWLNVYPVVGKNQSRTYVVKAEFAGYEMMMLSPGKSLWGNIIYFSERYAKSWMITLISVCFLSYFLVRKALQPVEASIQSQRNFVAAASHELKAPMAVIQTNAEALNGDNLEKKQRVILEECNRITGLIHSLLALASNDSGKQKLYLQEINVDTMMIEIWEAFEENARRKNIHLELGIDEHYPTIYCDGERLHQAIGILVDNAICYSPVGSSIFLGARVEKAKVVFSVIDHGIGIPNSEKEKVFERFYTCDSSRTDKTHYGLGLSIAEEIVKAHHGKIRLTDTPNGGCTFEVLIGF